MALKHYPVSTLNLDGAQRAGCGALIAHRHFDRDKPTCIGCIEYKNRADAHWESMREQMRERRAQREAATCPSPI